MILALWVAPAASPWVQVAGAFYRAGALVFGGGQGGIMGATSSVAAIFLPGFLGVAGVLPF